MSEKIRVLIVDDIAETRENIRKLLQYESDVDVVGAARTGRESIQLAQELDPDVVLMDINMPDMDGITATEKIRTKKPYIQVVILSVQGDQNYMRRAMLAGARNYLTKPPLADELVNAIRQAGEMARVERAKAKYVDGLAGPPDFATLLLEQQERELFWFDLYTRLELYQQSLVNGKLIDEIESLVIGLAHDIRSPINIILNILNTVKPANDAELNAFRRIWRRSIYCKWVADNFLGISLSEKLSPGIYQLKGIVAEVIIILDNLIHPDIKLMNQIDEDVKIFADPGSLRLIISNLILNSVESISKDGFIIIGYKRKDNQDILFVEDEGMPIPSEQIANLFKLGFTTKKSHAGIGLYVSRRLLRQQNGDLVFSQSMHRNLKRFSVLLPIQKSTKKDALNLPDVKRRIKELEQDIAHLSQEYTNYANNALFPSQKLELTREFQRLTFTFSKNLGNELLLIETTVRDVIKKLPLESEPLIHSLQKIIQNCSYCRLLTNNILALGEGAPPEIENVSLIDVMEEVLLLVDRKMPPDLYHVEWDVDPLLPTIKADPVQMKQVFMNLIKNALDAMPNGGILKLKLSAERGGIEAEVGDTGMGISKENMPRLFQLGFTTKPRGYGIGLFSIKKIIERHNGKIEAVSVPTRGTTFKIKLPVAQSEQI